MNKKEIFNKIGKGSINSISIAIGIIIISTLIINNCSTGHSCTGIFEVPVFFFIIIFSQIGKNIIIKKIIKINVFMEGLIFILLSFLISKIYIIFLYKKVANNFMNFINIFI